MEWEGWEGALNGSYESRSFPFPIMEVQALIETTPSK